MSTDWLPTKREDILAMARKWAAVLATQGEGWEVTIGEINALNNRLQNAVTNVTTAEANKGDRHLNAVATASMKTLTQTMRDLKRRRFTSPPLSDADLVSLDLKPRDRTHTAVGKPRARPIATVKIKGAGRFELHIEPESVVSEEDEKAYYGSKIVYEVFAQGDPAPTAVKELDENRFVRRKKELFVFQPEDSGKKAYFAIRYENSKGDAGPWCPIFSVLIP